VGAATAIKRGLERGHGGYWIHTSGTDILLDPQLLEGKRDTVKLDEVKVYNDWDKVHEVISFTGKICLPLPYFNYDNSVTFDSLR
jgi:hypothetical protein